MIAGFVVNGMLRFEGKRIVIEPAFTFLALENKLPPFGVNAVNPGTLPAFLLVAQPDGIERARAAETDVRQPILVTNIYCQQHMSARPDRRGAETDARREPRDFEAK